MDKLGPAIKPTNPNRTNDPMPNPAAQGLKPPSANEANKFIIFKNVYLGISIQIFMTEITILRHFFVIELDLLL